MSSSETTRNAIRHFVLSLSKIFRLDPTADSLMLDLTNRLESSISTFSTTQVNYQTLIDVLCDGNSNAEYLTRKFNELKLRNIHELVPSVYLYAKMKQNPALLSILQLLYDTHQSDRGTGDLGKSPNVTLTRKGVEQLQQMIADSTNPLSGTMQSVGNDRTWRSALTGSINGPIFGEPSRGESRLLGDNVSSPTRSGHSRARQEDLNVGGRRPTENTADDRRLPGLPNWLYDRPSLWNDFLHSSYHDVENYPKTPVHALSSEMQEHAVVSDLLRLLQGNQGIYIKPIGLSSPSAVRTFRVDENLSPTLIDAANKILPICADYSMISRFIDGKSSFYQGMVNHALASAMRRLIKDYFVLLCQLENEFCAGRLGIARLLFALQETSAMFAQLSRIAADIQIGNCTGGAVLSLLYDSARKVYGVQQLHELTTYLLRAASVPFFTILQKWIYRGVISDPYQEFFITSKTIPPFIQKTGLAMSALSRAERALRDNVDWASFWNQNYSVVSHNLPAFLESHLSKCLNAGKYLNVVQQCADAYELPSPELIEYDDADAKYLDQIDRAYSYASNLLLKLMIKEKDLKEHLYSVKRYFLLDRADFIVYFMDSAAQELCMPSSDVPSVRLSSLLELAIRTSTAKDDRFKDNLKLVRYKYDLITQIMLVLQAGSGYDQVPLTPPVEDINLTALEALSVEYQVDWPISLVLNRQVMDRYQMLFRHMFYCKHVERRLCSAWVLGKLARKADCLTSTWFTTSFLLGQRMLTFIQHFQYYMAVEVIEPTWHQFFSQIDKMSNLDALLDAHLHCLEVCMDDCLLASPELLSVFGKLTVVCVSFANFVQRVLSASVVGIENQGEFVDRAPRENRAPLLQDLTSYASSLNLTDGIGRRPASGLSNLGSTVSGDTIFTKVTRDDFDRFGSSEAFAQSVISFDRKFNSLLVGLVEQLKHCSKERNKLSSLASRLDYNDFYSNALVSPTGELSPIFADPTHHRMENRTAVVESAPIAAGATYPRSHITEMVDDIEDYI